jgi:hypothetical protein
MIESVYAAGCLLAPVLIAALVLMLLGQWRISKFALAVLLLLPTLVRAAPFLVCDDPPLSENVTHYGVRNVATDAIEVVPAPLHYDLAPLPDGAFDLEIWAINAWGESARVPFAGVKLAPGTPNGLALSTE